MTNGTKTKRHKNALIKQINPVCGICLQPIQHPESATVDHIKPLSLGGSNYRDNVQLAHPKCNRRKGNDPEYQPINLRKTKCMHCGRYFKSLEPHLEAKHKGSDLVKLNSEPPKTHTKSAQSDLTKGSSNET